MTWPLELASDSVFFAATAFGHTAVLVPTAAILEKQPNVPYALSYVEQPTSLLVPDLLFNFVDRAFHIDLLIDGQTQPKYTFTEPVTLMLEYLPVQDLDPNHLALFLYDRSEERWFSEGHWVSSIDREAQTVHVTVPQTGQYVLGRRINTLSVEQVETVVRLFLPMISGECELECQTRPSEPTVQLFLPTISK